MIKTLGRGNRNVRRYGRVKQGFYGHVGECLRACGRISVP